MIDVKVAKLTTEAKDILSFELVRPDGGALPAFTAGAHVDVHLPDGLVRQYSLCNPPWETHRYLLCVLREKNSRGGSAGLHGLQTGGTLTISEPRNLFPLAETATRSLLLAGGIGVTPIIAMAEHLTEAGAAFELHYFTRAHEHTAFHERISQSAFASRAVFHFDSERMPTAADFEAMLGGPEAGCHVYVCGPGGFMAAVLEVAGRLGWPAEQLHREYFAAAPVAAAAGSFEVEIASTGQVLVVPPERSVAQVLEAAGVPLALSCEQGVCGTCLTKVLSGEPEHHDLFLTDAEHAQNDQFTPCVSRALSKRLVLDL